MATVNISGIEYVVIAEKPFEFRGKTRTELHLRRPKGKKYYIAVRYESGAISNAITV